MSLNLTGYCYSVYTRAARMALLAKGLTHDYFELDPFDTAQSETLRALHPFGRVPVLDHDGFRLWETQAILDYLDGLKDTPRLTPEMLQARARMRQVMGLVDAYVYWPLVRQVVSHAIFLEEESAEADRAMLSIEAAISKSAHALDVLEEIAQEGLILTPGTLTLADCHFWPMLDYFRLVPEGAGMIAARRALGRWADAMAVHPVAEATQPDLAQLREGGS
jgi:glutathione S-transferase